MLKKGVTLRGIEVFEALAQTGSVAQTAVITGLSQPAVSQQMRNLETAVGAELVDHARRPMRLTLAGQMFLRRATAALTELRHAQSEVMVMDLADLEELNLGIIDDFDDDLTPRLTTILADSMTGCRFRMITDGSKELAHGIKTKALHMAISAQIGDAIDGIMHYPLVRDPFVLVLPAQQSWTAAQLLAGEAPLPFLQYASGQLISEQISVQLGKEGITLATRFEIGSHLALMAMVARGIGWAITTPLGYMRAARFHEGLGVRALPWAGAARDISLFASAEWSGPLPLEIAGTMRRLMQAHMISPAVSALPWLAEHFYLLENDTP